MSIHCLSASDKHHSILCLHRFAFYIKLLINRTQGVWYFVATFWCLTQWFQSSYLLQYESIWCLCYLWVTFTVWEKIVLFLQLFLPLEESKCSFVSGYQLEIASESGMEARVLFSSQLWDSSLHRPLQALCIPTSIYEFIWALILLIYRVLFPPSL